jgi:hypothetical protein
MVHAFVDSFAQILFQNNTRSKLTREQNFDEVPNFSQAGSAAPFPSGDNRLNGASSRPSITLKPDDVRRALECQLPPRKKDMKLLCKIDLFEFIIPSLN